MRACMLVFAKRVSEKEGDRTIVMSAELLNVMYNVGAFVNKSA